MARSLLKWGVQRRSLREPLLESTAQRTQTGMSKLPLSDQRLHEIVLALDNIRRETGFERHNQIGKLLFEQIFASDPNSHTRDAELESQPRQLSFRKLAGLLRGKISKSELHRSLRVYLLCQKLDFVPTSGRLTTSHVEAVLGLEAELQDQLLRTAHEQGLTVRQLRQLSRNPAAARVSARGIHLGSLARKASRHGQRTLEAFAPLLRDIPADSANLPPADMANLMKCVETLETTCAQLRHSIASNSCESPAEPNAQAAIAVGA